MMGGTLLIILAVVIAFAIKAYKYFMRTDASNAFATDDTVPVKPKVKDQKERDKVLKQNFKVDKIPLNLDAIVIGSGIGGLATAAILAKSGKKVLVLEQHDQAGGCCHTFIDKGYEFDVGIHYIGDMQYQSFTKTFVDQISDGQITWEPLHEIFDTVVIKEADKERVDIPIYSGVEKQKSNLKKLFPGEEEGIEKFYSYVFEVSKSSQSSMMVKFVPLWLANLLIKTSIIDLITSYFKWNRRSVLEVVSECTSNQLLRDVFCYCFGDYGTIPSVAGFPMQATLIKHFNKGAGYPIGGASEIAFHIIPVIERSGGKVLVNANVTEILLDPMDRAVGVKLMHGKQEMSVNAPIIVSNAGLYNTFGRLLPESLASQSRLWPLAKHTKPGVGAMSVFVGFNAPKEDLDIGEKKNYWVFTKKDLDKTCIDYLNLDKDVVEDEDIPLLFVSFPSTKDPTWEDRYPGKTTMAIITLANYSWFGDWENKPVMKRGDDYEGLKKTIGHKMIQHVCDMFPKIEKHIDYVNIGTPLSNQYYLGAPYGEIYGLDHSQERFNPTNTALLRPATDIEGLFLTGQDICSCGFTGGLYGGLFSAQQILGRNVVSDLTELHKKVRAAQKEKDE